MRNVQFKDEIQKTRILAEKELLDRKKGIPGESSIEELENTIIPELKALTVKMDNNELPPTKERYLLSFANAFTIWGWNQQEPTDLFVALTRLHNEFKNVE